MIQLYVVGVFTSFTLRQTGMVRRWLPGNPGGGARRYSMHRRAHHRGRPRGGRRGKSHGAWIVLIAVPVLVAVMLAVRRHYIGVAAQLRQVPPAGPTPGNRLLVLVAHSDEASDRAIRYAELIRNEHIQVIHAVEADSDDLINIWDRIYPDHRLELIEDEDESVVGRLLARVRLEATSIPSRRSPWWCPSVSSAGPGCVLSHPNLLLLKARLLFEPGIAVTDLTSFKRRRRSGLPQVPMRRVELVVLVSDLTRPIRDAIAYAESLGPPVRTVHIDVDDTQRDKVVDQWATAGYPYELELVPSPYREVTSPLVGYVGTGAGCASPEPWST